MSITQSVDIPASRRLTIDVPREVPTGPVILTFTPVPERAKIAPRRMSAQEVLNRGLGFGSGPRMDPHEALEAASGIAKRLGSTLTSGQSIAWRREEQELEEAQYRRLYQKDNT